jgi:DnaJ family protein A protein 2
MPGGGRGRGGRRKGEDVVHPLKVSLEELYNGTTKKLSLAKNVICSKCDGCAARRAARSLRSALTQNAVRQCARERSKGSKSGNTGRCAGCQGAGVKIHLRQIAPGMVQQMQAVCPDCRGAGAWWPARVAAGLSAARTRTCGCAAGGHAPLPSVTLTA